MKDIVKRLGEALWATEGRNQSSPDEKSSGKDRHRMTCAYPPFDGMEAKTARPRPTAETGRYDKSNGRYHRSHQQDREKRPTHICDRRK
jgi:hypothetical protein